MSTTLPDRPDVCRRGHSVLVQWWDLFLMELTNWRWSWRLSLLQGTITPLFSLLALGVFARDSGSEALTYVVTGNIVVSLLFGTMSNVESRVSWLRFQGGLDYVATLPIRRYAFVLAMVAAFLLISLPSILVTTVLGPVLLRVPVAIHPLILLVIPCCTIPLAGVGAALGMIGRTQQVSGNLRFLLMLVMAGLGPVVVPPDHLPGFMLVLGRFSPATYAASALRQVMIGPVTSRLLVDVVVLLGVSAVSMWWVGRRMNVREE
jgi:ABC-2 type transport system permease protein